MDQNMNMGGMPEEKKSVGPLVGIVIVVLVLIAGAVYVFMDSKKSIMEQPAVMEQQVNAGTMTTDATLSALSEQGASTDILEIEKDLQATDFSDLDAGLADVSSSL
ncbi:MAG: hypothetical protein AAB552_03800 [Patescibacteria group bacterium]